MTDDGPAADPAPHADPGLRTLGRVALGGTLLALAAAAAATTATGAGRSGLAVLLLVGALTAVAVGLVGTVALLRDEIRDLPASRARIAWTIGGFLATPLLLAMVVGVTR